MPYRGVRCKSGSLIINVKVFQANDDFNFDTKGLVQLVGIAAKTQGVPQDSTAAIKIADLLSPSILLDNEAPWFEVEVFDSEGGVYGVARMNEEYDNPN